MRISRLVILSACLGAVAFCGCDLASSEKAAIEHYVNGQILADQGDLDAALEELARAVRVDPSLSVAYTATGDIYRKRGSYELARRSYETSCRVDPYDFRPHYNLGVTYQILAEAAKVAEKVEELLRAATRVYLRAITILPDDFDANLNISACYFQLGKYDQAEQYCRSAIRINPRSTKAQSNLGAILDTQDRLYEAIGAYKASLELDTKQPDTLLNLGAVYMRQGQVLLARNVFQIAAEQDPDSDAPWERLGSCYFRLRKLDMAVEAYLKAISLNARNAAAQRGLGAVYMSQFLLDKSGQRTDLRDKGLEAWRASLGIDPSQPKLVKLIDKYAPKYSVPEL